VASDLWPPIRLEVGVCGQLPRAATQSYHGKFLAIVRSANVAGPIRLLAEAEGLVSASVVIQLKSPLVRR
jgi:hypothetical protein